MKICFALMFLSVVITCFGQSKNNSLPFILQDEEKLSSYRDQYRDHDKNAVQQVDSLLADADRILKAGQKYSVTFLKSKPASSGDIHDYISQAPYWWPDTTKHGGIPYINRDGRINPERNLSRDYGQMGKMAGEVKQLSLAYYFTANERYAGKAVELLKTWFIDTATRMNPNLNYGQFIPGITAGRGIGIIETVGLTNIPDAVAMLQTSSNVNREFIADIKQWFKQYADWLITSKNGKEERAAKNNHGTYYDMQLADFALFTDNTELAKKVITEQTLPRIDQQFTTEGAEPLELTRTKSWNYSTMNLVGWTKLAIIADRVNIDLWHKETVDGKGIKRVLDWFIPYTTKEKKWTHEQIEPITYNNILKLYNLASVKYPGNSFQKVLELYPEAKQQQPWW